MDNSLPITYHLSGNWQVCSIPLDRDIHPDRRSFTEALTVPDATHLQLVLYPEQPYWGDHIRAVNETDWIYRRTFVPPNSSYQRARLCFDGVDYFASVWLNDHFIGQHEGHFSPFMLDVTTALRPNTENILIVRVSAPWDAANPRGNYPVDHVTRGLVKGLYEHGEGVIPPNVNPLGIWRPVRLLLDAGISMDHVRIQTELDGTVGLHFTMANATEHFWQGNLLLEVEGENHDGPGINECLSVHLSPGTQQFEYTLSVPQPHLWWSWDHGKPNLYRLIARLMNTEDRLESTLTETFGIRTIHLERQPDKFVYRLNEREVFIRGSSYMPGIYLSECTLDTLERDILLAQEANLNLLRVHVHVSLPDLYDLCDRVGMLIWQDFELNWIHDASPEFETRAIALQRDMIRLLGNHPSIITWCCYNEPTMVFVRRHNLEQHPAPALYAHAQRQDTTRPVFLCSGQMRDDWQRAGDEHTYYGALWTTQYTDIYGQYSRLNTEFGFETPAHRDTLQTYSDVWERLQHLDEQIDDLWTYQAELIQFHVEHFRRLRAECCAGYIQFWLADLVPQVGCGVLDSNRQPKGGYTALQRSSQPLLVALEHDGHRPLALWVFNDTLQTYDSAGVHWEVFNNDSKLLLNGQASFDIAANSSQQIIPVKWSIDPESCASIHLTLLEADGTLLSQITYTKPFQPMLRPRGYPWKFDRYLGTKVFDRPGAPSLADQSNSLLMKWIPLMVREKAAEWGLRQQLPIWLVSRIAAFIDRFM